MATSSQILDILKDSPSVALLRSRSCSVILEFFMQVFDSTAKVSTENIHSQLSDFLSNNDIEKEEDDNDILITDTYEEKAEKYINRWTAKGFLTNYRNEDGEIYYELSSYSSKVIDWLSGLKPKEYVGTESKFRSIITQLKELVEYTNEDKEKRLQLLEDKKLEIEQQIQQLKIGEIKVFEEYEIVPRFQQISQLAKELLSDFKDVDDNFKAIIREIYKKQIDPTLNKGGILQYTFDALDELKSSSQGKSFYAFWEFLLAREMQTELDGLITELFQTLKDRNIDSSDTFLKNMVSYLYESGRKVYQTNDKMAEKLGRIIRENENSKFDDTKRIIQDIKNTLIEISNKKGTPDISLMVDYDLDINIPFDRKLTFEQTENVEYELKPESLTLSINDFGELGKVFGNVAIDRKKLERNIRETLKGQSQTTLFDVIVQHPLEQGLPELFAYFGILNHYQRKSINEVKQQAVVFDTEHNKRILIPEIIISK